ncbi:MAG: HD domain-containing protein [Bacteroidota bacterium]
MLEKTINIDLIQRAWELASYYHKDQVYAGPEEGQQIPYLTHLGAVAFEVQQAVSHRPELDAQLALLCAILHDTLEDTAFMPTELEALFGPPVLAGVQALTKNEALPDKRTQMLDSLDRILKEVPEVAMVKMADRICNLAPPPFYWNESKAVAYREEAALILDRLGAADAYLASRLAAKIQAYPGS